jgi:hypothetical protein
LVSTGRIDARRRYTQGGVATLTALLADIGKLVYKRNVKQARGSVATGAITAPARRLQAALREALVVAVTAAIDQGEP